MGENLHRHLAGLEAELDYARARKDTKTEQLVKAEIAKTKRLIGSAEKAVAAPAHTPEDGAAEAEKTVEAPAETTSAPKAKKTKKAKSG
jgi:hypothetical protein